MDISMDISMDIPMDISMDVSMDISMDVSMDISMDMSMGISMGIGSWSRFSFHLRRILVLVWGHYLGVLVSDTGASTLDRRKTVIP